jgi:hypothetical protein
VHGREKTMKYVAPVLLVLLAISPIKDGFFAIRCRSITITRNTYGLGWVASKRTFEGRSALLAGAFLLGVATILLCVAASYVVFP